MYISENFKTELKYSCDVLVCGGGIAGIAAAISAARSGKSVILTERQFMLGGLATAGLVTIYLPLCDGMGNQVSFGLAEELLKLSISHWHNDKRGYSNWIENTDIENNEKTPRYEVDFNPQLFAISAEQLLLKENVKILYGTTAVAASVENDKIKAVIFENKSGRFGITAKTFIDAQVTRIWANSPIHQPKHLNKEMFLRLGIIQMKMTDTALKCLGVLMSRIRKKRKIPKLICFPTSVIQGLMERKFQIL